MHAGHIESSARLRHTASILTAGWHTTREISRQTGSMAVHSDIAGLRANGIPVESERIKGAPGTCVFHYRIMPEFKEPAKVAVVPVEPQKCVPVGKQMEMAL